MARNAATSYGRDVLAVFDADPLFSDGIGLDIIRQDAIHRLTTDDVLGDDGTGSFAISGWGYDTRRLLGVTAARLSSLQPVLSEVLGRDPRILTADVTITPVLGASGLADVSIAVSCDTADGPFTFVRLVSELTSLADVAGGT